MKLDRGQGAVQIADLGKGVCFIACNVFGCQLKAGSRPAKEKLGGCEVRIEELPRLFRFAVPAAVIPTETGGMNIDPVFSASADPAETSYTAGVARQNLKPIGTYCQDALQRMEGV